MGMDVWHTLAHYKSFDVRHRDARAVRDEQLSERIFLGDGAAPLASSAGNFTLLGSVTPEGRVLFNTLSRGISPSLYGTAAAMRPARNACQHLRSDRQSNRRIGRHVACAALRRGIGGTE